MTPWSWALLSALPEFFRRQILQPRPGGRLSLMKVATEELLSQMVAAELASRASRGEYKGSFSPVCHYFGLQGRSAMPSDFDCALGEWVGTGQALGEGQPFTPHCRTVARVPCLHRGGVRADRTDDDCTGALRLARLVAVCIATGRVREQSFSGKSHVGLRTGGASRGV